VVITRRRHPLEGRALPVLGRMRRHGQLELLLVLPDGSKSLIPSAWTDLEEPTNEETVHTPATLGSLADLLAVCVSVAELAGRRLEQGQAAGKSPCEEDSRAACPAQFDARSGSGAITDDRRGAAGQRDRDRGRAAGGCDRENGRPVGNRGGHR